MYSKLSFRNIKRSFRDYTIYFLTIVFAVCIFYTFNSIESQKVLMDINQYQEIIFKTINKVMGIASVFIAGILAFLIIYANNYLIKRRKKELGVYMTLGMERKSIGKILFIETFLIGLISFVIGIALGVLLSQGLSILTAKMFTVDLTSFKFIFSKEAFIKTLICFGIIYAIVLIFNSRSIKKIKLIDLLYAAKKNEKSKIKNIWISVILFIISVIMILYAYRFVLKMGLAILGGTMLIPIILGTIGTFLFFMSLTGFLLKLAQSSQKYYFKNLNMFVLRQINSKINTTFISMSFICLMLFWAICTLSGGLGINIAMNSNLKDLTPYDMTIQDVVNGSDIEKELEKSNINLYDYFDSYTSYNLYTSNLGYKELFKEESEKAFKTLYPISSNQPVSLVKLSDFNKEMKALGKENITLNDNEFGIYSDVDEIYKVLEKKFNKNTKVTFNDNTFAFKENALYNITFNNSQMKSNIATIIVNDKYLNVLKSKNTFINGNYKGDRLETNKKIEEKFNGNENLKNSMIVLISDEMIKVNSQGLGTMIAYLAIYMGIVFLITSAAILALQQLSEAADNVERYRLLRKIGVDDKEINRSIFSQVIIYFMLPLSLAIVHSIVGLSVVKDVITVFGTGGMGNVIITFIVFVIIYGGYFMATYTGSKNMIKSNLK